MDEQSTFQLYFADGDRVAEFQRLISEHRDELSGCRYDCWYQPQTKHTALTLMGSCDALREALTDQRGWYRQPLSWKRP
jgi:hypothetical protein